MGLRAWSRQHWLAVDVIIAVGFVLIDASATLGGASWWPSHPGTLAWSMLGVQALADLSLIARKRAPLIVIGIIAAFTLAISLLVLPAGAIVPANSGNVWAPFAAVLAAYGPFYYPKDRRASIAAVVILTAISARIWDPSATVIAIAVGRTALGPLLGLYLGARRCMIRALTDRAERAERERYLLAEQARAEERARLAGEMHDVVTHRLSLMVLQAGALGITATDDATRRAAEDLRAGGCQALDELRDLVGILRTSPEGDESPSTEGFAALIAESTAVGTPTELTEEGDRALASPVVGRSAYKIIRESLTNVRKHAPGARVEVTVRYDDSQVHLTVRNTRPAIQAVSDLAATGSGLGIASLRQRVELVGGTLRAGTTPDGGFCLEATLPAYVPTADAAALAGQPTA
ncbi:MAG TPA: histidine kinase [Streptosporangiaceae bacterium]|nr:histidine kinase [Streptosporangiaceae bacterium]